MAKKFPEYVTDLNARIDALKADVAEGKTVNASVIALMNGLQAEKAALKAQLEEILALGATPEAIAQLQTVVTGMDETDAAFDANTKELADAVVANTSAAQPTE